MKYSSVCILGGSGFVGRHLASQLGSHQIHSRIPSRNPQRHRQLALIPNTQLVKARQLDEADLTRLFDGCEAVINLVGVLNETAGNNFHQAHVTLSQQVVSACKAAGVKRLLHMSALNAHQKLGTSHYLKSKGEAEAYALDANGDNLKVTSFRPSVIFGTDDSFFNRFATLLRILPGPFLLACPNSRFSPVFVGDVAKAMHVCLDNPTTFGQHYELCGPNEMTLIELVRYTAHQLQLNKPILGLGDGLSAFQARLLGMVPGKPFSYDNYLSLKMDSVCTTDGLDKLGIKATNIDAVVPYYLSGKSERRRYNQLRQQS